MESRNIALTLKKAREWYNSGSADLKEVALQAYTKEELTMEDWRNITAFGDVVDALGLSTMTVATEINRLKSMDPTGHLAAIYKLDIIRKALNQDWNPSLVEGAVYYPYVRFYPADKARKVASENQWTVKETFIADDKKYSLVGGDYNCYYCDGLGNFGGGYGDAGASLGLLGCKSLEIAAHMSRYFAKEVFEACYAQHHNYTWV